MCYVLHFNSMDKKDIIDKILKTLKELKKQNHIKLTKTIISKKVTDLCESLVLKW